MQVRRFKELIKANYIVQNKDTYLAVGSPYAHDIITVDVDTLKVKAITGIGNSSEINFIVMQIENLPREVLEEIISKDDVIENPLPVFMWRDGKIHETQTEDYKYPNTDHKGYLLYDNTTFKTKAECAKSLRNNMKYSIAAIERRVTEEINGLQTLLKWVKKYRKSDEYLSEIEAGNEVAEKPPLKIDGRRLYYRIGLNIKECRKERKLRQEELAQLLKVDRTTLSGYESGKARVSLIKIYEIAYYLNKKVHDLLPERFWFDDDED
ncbi:MAG: helix-turn-helix transcriptional regulator [Treponema sp.]|nr:helix-turn-helix transcriptional regulator [Treponema sp.]